MLHKSMMGKYVKRNFTYFNVISGNSYIYININRIFLLCLIVQIAYILIKLKKNNNYIWKLLSISPNTKYDF